MMTSQVEEKVILGYKTDEQRKIFQSITASWFFFLYVAKIV
jgi:hypothetical protein